jgi:hypothetical protein
MPFIGLGLHILIALYFAVHAVRSGQQLYWLVILFSFPMLGSIVYFAVIYLPNSRLQHGARKAVSAAARTLDPTRELREARAAFDYTPTAQNQMRLAEAQLEVGQAKEALANFEACLKGPLASDPEIKFGAARASLECGQPGQALAHLGEIRAANEAFRPEQLSLLMARALGDAGRRDEARTEFEWAVNRFGSYEAVAEFAIWAWGTGDQATAQRLDKDLAQLTQRWNRHTRELNQHVTRRLEAARAQARRG